MENNYNKTTARFSENVATAREGEITIVFKKLQEGVELATKQFTDLTSKLAPILREIGPEPMKDKAIPVYSSPLSQSIDSICEKVSHLTDYIQSIKDRVEL